MKISEELMHVRSIIKSINRCKENALFVVNKNKHEYLEELDKAKTHAIRALNILLRF